ncbi:MAG: N-formylglutamate amidohydrolase [Novosphingobium sp.]|nr:N-formylglutamate amidohydrolase [Novosphingobium sp.]
MTRHQVESDSFRKLGGIIPGTPGTHAWSLSGLNPSAIPVVIAVPHAGRAYSGPLLKALRNPEAASLRLEDRLADSIGRAVAKETGAMLLVANAPRAMIDLNRAPEDVDWEMFGSDDRPLDGHVEPSRRARSGLGLIPRRVPGTGELWKRQHRSDELSARIAGIHAPYHDVLAEVLAGLRARWGVAVLLDLHSMPPIPQRGAASAAQFVTGDCFGASCHADLASTMMSFLEENQCACAYNRPYAGGYTLERHGDPSRGVHAVQLEIDRSVYLDAGLSRLGDGYPRLVRLLGGLVRGIVREAMTLGDDCGREDWRDAAE